MLSFRKVLIPAAAGASLLLAACGSSSSHPGSTSTAAIATPAASQAGSSSGAALEIGTASSAAGTYLTAASGRALYLWVAESNGKSSCAGACAQAWPPLTASSMPNVTGGAKAGDLTLISRADGTKQVAYKGHPLYYFAGDTGAGMTHGQGSDGFGAKWWLLTPSGSEITHVAVAASTSSSSTSGGSSGGFSGGGWG